MKDATIKSLEEQVVECSFVVFPRELNEVNKLVRRIKKVFGFKKLRFE